MKFHTIERKISPYFLSCLYWISPTAIPILSRYHEILGERVHLNHLSNQAKPSVPNTTKLPEVRVLGTAPFESGKIPALNCRLISRTATTTQSRCREILGVRVLRTAFRIRQKTSAPNTTQPPEVRALGTPPFESGKILALNCRLISRTTTATQPRCREILGVRVLRTAFRIKQKTSAPKHHTAPRSACARDTTLRIRQEPCSQLLLDFANCNRHAAKVPPNSWSVYSPEPPFESGNVYSSPQNTISLSGCPLLVS